MSIKYIFKETNFTVKLITTDIKLEVYHGSQFQEVYKGGWLKLPVFFRSIVNSVD